MSEERLVEMVPNVSEGRDLESIRAMAESFAALDGVWLLDVHSDPHHNRSVLTAVARPSTVLGSVRALAARAVELIDLRSQRGIHPRVGALDVLPLVGVKGVTSGALRSLAETLARALASEFEIPVCFYGELATRETHRTLATLRRGGFEGLDDRIRDREIVPDFGAPRAHPTAGLTALTVRDYLIAFNVNLRTEALAPAKAIARAVRASSGGLAHLQALAFPLEGRSLVQVSMNLTDFRVTSLRDAYDAVASEAAGRDLEIDGSEVVGLIPEAASFEGMEEHLRLAARPGILERRLADAMG